MIPVLLELGPIPLRSYGLMMALAFALGIWFARRRARAAGINPDVIIDFAFVVIIASILGSRFAYVAGHWPQYVSEPIGVLRIWDGGLTQYGGFVAGIAAGLLFFRVKGIDPWRGADLVAPSLALGVALGRIGCFLNGCCFGKTCDLPWAVTFPEGSPAWDAFLGAPVHPTQLYAALAALGIFFVLLAVDRKKPYDGFLLWLFVILLAAYRFLIDPIRQYSWISMIRNTEKFSLTRNQVMGLVLIAVSLAFMFYLRKRDLKSRGAA
jgi:phosphatidylglycerol:prolipoprotein diacylglycerol transferase